MFEPPVTRVAARANLASPSVRAFREVNMKTKDKTEYAVPTIISVVMLGLIIVHAVKPQLKVDGVTFGLVCVGVIPWLYRFVKDIKLPGGYGVTFRDLIDASDKVDGRLESVEAAAMTGVAATGAVLEQVGDLDPNLAVAGLRIEIEKLVRLIAVNRGVPSAGPLRNLIKRLAALGVFPPTMADGLDSIVQLGNAAVHGATVDPEAVNWARIQSLHVLNTLKKYEQPEPRTL